jgi:retron-type reverse transcriptase
MKNPQTFLPNIQWIAEKAAQDPNFVFQRITHHLDEELLQEAFHRLRKDAAPGIDGQTAAEYAEDLRANLSDLYERLRTRTYRATPIKRTWIPKEDGSQRPIGTLILEDKIVQKAVAMLLEEVFEQEFVWIQTGTQSSQGPSRGTRIDSAVEHRLDTGCRHPTIL